MMTTILLQHRLTLALKRKLLVFAHCSNREIQGLLFMWRWWLLLQKHGHGRTVGVCRGALGGCVHGFGRRRCAEVAPGRPPVVMVACSWRGAEPLMACLHTATLNRVVVISLLGIIVAKCFRGGDRGRLHPAPYSVCVQFRQSRFCVGSRSKRRADEETAPRIILMGNSAR